MKQSSRARLTPFTASEFQGATLFDAVGRALCEAACLPRKELFESWAVAKRVHRRLGGPWRATRASASHTDATAANGESANDASAAHASAAHASVTAANDERVGRASGELADDASVREAAVSGEPASAATGVLATPTGGLVWDLAAGHGLVAWLLLLLDASLEGAVCVDKRRPESAGRVDAILSARWPRLAGRVRWEEARVQDVRGIDARALVVSAHACSTLTDAVLDVAIAARARVAVLPCCQSLGKSDMGGLEAWVEGPLAVDIMRVARLKAAGYDVHLQKIPEEITPKNRLILGKPPAP